MDQTVLITGASSGIGMELAKMHASKGNHIVLVARNFKKLEQLKLEIENKYRVSVMLIKKELSLSNAAQEVYREVSKQKIRIDYLINNAGFGDYGWFYETNWEKEQLMLPGMLTKL